MARCTDIFRLK